MANVENLSRWIPLELITIWMDSLPNFLKVFYVWFFSVLSIRNILLRIYKSVNTLWTSHYFSENLTSYLLPSLTSMDCQAISSFFLTVFIISLGRCFLKSTWETKRFLCVKPCPTFAYLMPSDQIGGLSHFVYYCFNR